MQVLSIPRKWEGKLVGISSALDVRLRFLTAIG